MLKRVISFFIIAVMLLTTVAYAYEAKDVVLLKGAFSVKVDGNYIKTPAHYDYNSQIVYFPLRAVFETLGYEVLWDGNARTININKNGVKINEYLTEYKPAVFEYSETKVYPDSAIINIEGNPVVCDMFLFEDRTYVSASSLEPYMAHLYVDSQTQTARVYSDEFKELDDNTALVYGDKALDYTRFMDLTKFIYGNFETGVSQNFAELENYLIFNGAVKKISNDLGLKVTEDEKAEFSTVNNVEATLKSTGIEDTKFFNDEIITDYVLREKLTTGSKTDWYSPTDEELKAYYSTLPEGKGIWLQAQHILVSKGEDNEGYKKAEELLKKVNEKGADFDSIMLENSEDPGSKTNPQGYIFTEGQMVESFYEGALSLKEGEISGIVESEYGYHIIKKIKHWENGIPLETVKENVIASYNDKVFGEKLYEYAAKEDVFYIKGRLTEKLSDKKEK